MWYLPGSGRNVLADLATSELMVVTCECHGGWVAVYQLVLSRGVWVQLWWCMLEMSADAESEALLVTCWSRGNLSIVTALFDVLPLCATIVLLCSYSLAWETRLYLV